MTTTAVRKLYTFLDSDDFISNWGFGEDNCGNAINQTAKGVLQRNENIINGFSGAEVLDFVGRYTVTIGGKSYDTVCVMDIMSEKDGIAIEQYLDKNGKTYVHWYDCVSDYIF